MVKKQGDHLNPHDTKSYIIEFILGNNGPVGEPTIRDHLKENYDLRDQGTINRHLHHLKNSRCIELIQNEKGLRNKWDITKAEHLINIKKKCSKIQLKIYNKSLMIIHQKNNLDILSLEGLLHYVMLVLSVSFFNACLDNSIEILCDRAWGIYQVKHHVEFAEFDESIDYIYSEYKTRFPKIKIAEENFSSMIYQMSQRELEDSTETFMKIWEEEFLSLSKETLGEMHRETMDGDLEIYKRIRDIISGLFIHRSIFGRVPELLTYIYIFSNLLLLGDWNHF